MPRPTLSILDNESLQANKIFVDRDEPRKLFAEMAEQIPADSAELMIFYGASGQGKSALCGEFHRMLSGHLRTRFREIRHGLVDLKEHELSDPALVTFCLREAFAVNHDLRFPAFDVGFAAYWNTAYPGQSMPTFRGGWLAQPDEASSLTLRAVHETVSAAVEMVPVVGSALRRLGELGIETARRHYTQRTNEALKPIFAGGEIVPPFEIRKQLPRLLASDLENARDRQPALRFVLLIDEYERIFESGGLAAHSRDNAFDEAIREFVANVSGALIVIFGRERIAWSSFKPEWKDWVEGAHHLVGGLAEQDADTFLRRVPVSEAEIRMAMIESASTLDSSSGEKEVLPVMLDLAVGHYLSLKRNQEKIDSSSFAMGSIDFAGRRHELLRRFLRKYDENLESTLKRLAVARRFDRAAATMLIKRFATGFPLDRIGDLVRLSFVDKLPDREVYVIHQVIAEGLVALLESADLRDTQEALFEHFAERAHSKDPRALDQSHAQALLEAAYYKTQLAASEVLSWWTETKQPFNSALFAPILEQFERSLLADIEKTLPPQHPDVAYSLNHLAANLDLQGRYEEAGPLLQRALKILEASLPAQHPNIATSLNNLALNLDSQGRYNEAEPLHRRALEISEASLPAQHPDIATDLNNLAANLDSQVRYNEAEPLLRRALKIRKASLPAQHSDIATSLNNLAMNLDSQGRYDEAETLHRRTLEILEASLPAQHPNIAMSLNNLAMNLDSQGRHEEAELPWRRVQEIQRPPQT